MKRRDMLLCVALVCAVTTPVLGQSAATKSADDETSVPGFSGPWRHQSLPGFEPLPSGPTSLKNLSRRNGVSNYDELVGDYNNPILKPETAEIVKRHGELSKSGVTYGN